MGVEVPFPVVAFGRLLRALRRGAGLSQLRAAELTSYPNYERWESGRTRVGPQHLANIGVGFGLDTHDLGLLVFGWLSDRLVPAAGDRERRLELGTVLRWLAELPAAFVELGEFADVPPEAASCSEVALTYLLACYGERDRCGHWTLRVAPTPRAEPPERDGPGLLDEVYGYAVGEAVELLIDLAEIGWEPNVTAAERPLAAAAVTMLTHERVIDGFGTLAAAALRGDLGGLDPDRLSVLGSVARLAPELSALGVRVRCEFRRFLEAALGHRVDYRQSERFLVQVASGDLEVWEKVVAEAEAAGRPLPEPNPRLTHALTDLLERAVEGCRPYLVERHGQSQVDEFKALVAVAREMTGIRRSA